MKPEYASERLANEIAAIEELRTVAHDSEELRTWQLSTQNLVKNIFGDGSDQHMHFCHLDFEAEVVTWDKIYDDDDKYQRKLTEARAVLTSFKAEVDEFGLTLNNEMNPNSLEKLDRIFRRFHSVVKQLRQRHSSRDTLDVTDEYDVQDLLHALLKLDFDDIRAEEWTPSYGAGSSRMDFLLKDEKLVIEVKMTRDSMTDRDLVDQLVIDHARYAAHQDCERLVCFVYDPLGKIGNPFALLTDITDDSADVPLILVIKPNTD